MIVHKCMYISEKDFHIWKQKHKKRKTEMIMKIPYTCITKVLHFMNQRFCIKLWGYEIMNAKFFIIVTFSCICQNKNGSLKSQDVFLRFYTDINFLLWIRKSTVYFYMPLLIITYPVLITPILCLGFPGDWISGWWWC